MECDAITMWLKISKNLDRKVIEKGLHAWGWGATIHVGEQYYNYEFVDELTGELFELNVKQRMDGYMRRFDLYPQIIKNAIDNFKIEF